MRSRPRSPRAVSVPGSASDRTASLLLVSWVACVLLGVKVFCDILAQYRWYWPLNFGASGFLAAHRSDFELGVSLLFNQYTTAFYIHIVVSPIVLVLATYLMWSVQSRLPEWAQLPVWLTDAKRHRIVGKWLAVLTLAFLVPSGLLMATRAISGPPAAAGFMVLSLLTAICTVMAAVSARNQRWIQHRRWTWRLWILLLSPLLLRIASGIAIQVGIETPLFYQCNAWLSWLAPLTLHELTRWRGFPVLVSMCGKQLAMPSIRLSEAEGRGERAGAERLERAATVRLTRRGLTILELLAVMLIVAIALALLMPAVRTSRGAARRMQCQNNLKQLSLACHNYESAWRMFPTAMGGTGVGPTALSGNFNRLSGMVSLTGFVEGSRLAQTIAVPLSHRGNNYPAGGPAPWVEEYPPWNERPSYLWCPSDERTAEQRPRAKSYGFCIGDCTLDLHNPVEPRGLFAARHYTKVADVHDGLSYTIGLVELTTESRRKVVGSIAIAGEQLPWAPSLCMTMVDRSGEYYLRDVERFEEGRGANWVDGAAAHGLVNTIFPPNGPSCMAKMDIISDGVYSASSLHTGGCNAAMADGSVQFFSHHIDTGDLAASPVASVGDESPYGVWGALGSRSGNEKNQWQQ